MEQLPVVDGMSGGWGNASDVWRAHDKIKARKNAALGRPELPKAKPPRTAESFDQRLGMRSRGGRKRGGGVEPFGDGAVLNNGSVQWQVPLTAGRPQAQASGAQASGSGQESKFRPRPKTRPGPV